MRARLPGAVLVAMLVAVSCGDAGGTARPGPDPHGAPATTAAGEPLAAAVDHGAWRPLPEAPIGTRPYAVSGWTGSEAVFWAGSNLERNFAHTLGAAYSPATDSWRELAVPGWGHPGLTGAVLENRMYVAAKGGATLIELADGSWVDLPHIQGFVPATVVAADGDVWAVGPTHHSDELPVAVGIARYDPVTQAWEPGPAFDGVPELGPLFQDLLFVEQPVLWTGSEVVVWSAAGRGVAFDPEAGSWRLLPRLEPPEGTLTATQVTVAGSHLVALAEVDRVGTPGYGVASWDGSAWEWRDTGVEVADIATVTIAGARDWIVVFGPEGPPQTVHVPTGDAMRHADAPIGGVQAPNAVWTGSELVVWGGAPTRSEGSSIPPVAAAWSPPESG